METIKYFLCGPGAGDHCCRSQDFLLTSLCMIPISFTQQVSNLTCQSSQASLFLHTMLVIILLILTFELWWNGLHWIEPLLKHTYHTITKMLYQLYHCPHNIGTDACTRKQRKDCQSKPSSRIWWRRGWEMEKDQQTTIWQTPQQHSLQHEQFAPPLRPSYIDSCFLSC